MNCINASHRAPLVLKMVDIARVNLVSFSTENRYTSYGFN